MCVFVYPVQNSCPPFLFHFFLKLWKITPLNVLLKLTAQVSSAVYPAPTWWSDHYWAVAGAGGDGGSPASEGGSYIGRHGGNHPATVSTQSLLPHAALNMLHSPQCCTLHLTYCTLCTVIGITPYTQHVAQFPGYPLNSTCCIVLVLHFAINNIIHCKCWFLKLNFPYNARK